MKAEVSSANVSDDQYLLSGTQLWLDSIVDIFFYFVRSSVSEVCSEFGIQKLSLLRELCRKTGKFPQPQIEQTVLVLV